MRIIPHGYSIRHSLDQAVPPKAEVINVQKVNERITKYGEIPPELKEAHIVPKGTQMYRATDKVDLNKSGPTYVSYLDVDRWNWKHNLLVPLWEHIYTLNEDLIIPSRKEVHQTVFDILFENPELEKETIKKYREVCQCDPNNAIGKLSINDLYSRFKKMPKDDAAFFVMQSLVLNNKVKSKLIKKLSPRGYNAMTDEAGVNGQGGNSLDGADDLIIFECRGKLTETANNKITPSDERQAGNSYLRVFNMLNKQRRK